MLRRTTAGALISVAIAAFSLVGGVSSATAATTSPTPEQARQTQSLQTTLYYDDSRAAEFKDAVAKGAQSWNDNVNNVTLKRAAPGQRAEITVYASNGWPRAILGPVRPGGSVWIEMGRQAVNQGHDPVRIAAHEFGHSLGLPDMKPGPCSSLMSGSTGGVNCKNATPNAAERARAERNYGVAEAGRAPAAGVTVVDAP
ncbi:metalloprotease [Nocardiopsis gilva YIM 90087]|uniref:Extracellular small neutral protease n=1 Tax=Nocardiopsis gilva YIM 90087 TaxID=1235441 RepID=A0A223SCL8_9ACTN|nr:snapalysin family zinc-dependent metalloprotease [Nocardiopsis gilva]ASU85852.1 metalloprotease [Nocardiopsis gilva YIM 90087]